MSLSLFSSSVVSLLFSLPSFFGEDENHARLASIVPFVGMDRVKLDTTGGRVDEAHNVTCFLLVWRSAVTADIDRK